MRVFTAVAPAGHFIQDEAEAKRAIGLFMDYMDRTISDAFCHADIGPEETRAGRLILEVCASQKNVLPKISLRYDPARTSDAFALQSVKTALQVARPSFANDVMYRRDYGGRYAIASCYNSLKIGGGGYTLIRLLMGNVAKRAQNSDDFFARVLPEVLDIFVRFMDARVRFIVEESGFFESNFLVKEGFIVRENFTGMFGLVGLAECVNTLLEKDGVEGRYGHSDAAKELGLRVMDAIQAFNDAHEAPYCEASGGRYVFACPGGHRRERRALPDRPAN